MIEAKYRETNAAGASASARLGSLQISPREVVGVKALSQQH